MEVWIKHQDTANSEPSRVLLIITKRKKCFRLSIHFLQLI